MQTDQFELPQMPPRDESRRRRERKVICTRANYVESCRLRYHGQFLRDAVDNWGDYEEQRETFDSWIQHYSRDPYLRVGDKSHNPQGTLTEMIWLMQTAINPDRSCLFPCLDFNDHHQSVHIRRGLIQYLTLLLKEIEP